jgi:hypothetical protein
MISLGVGYLVGDLMEILRCGDVSRHCTPEVESQCI